MVLDQPGNLLLFSAHPMQSPYIWTLETSSFTIDSQIALWPRPFLSPVTNGDLLIHRQSWRSKLHYETSNIPLLILYLLNFHLILTKEVGLFFKEWDWLKGFSLHSFGYFLILKWFTFINIINPFQSSYAYI